ncbi:HD domain-containing protein [Actinotalea fermentans]|uniref:Metal-dependent phosphohydrolase, HD subdomain protein n=1 Tax=Actinotalea fermentans TaxID=43671 RepID=A0A511YYI0_9CELL|nr:HD domain-containing protein [Actinotalea fermentans]GEN80244.1 metal-dependent phosphohydrolase, HD subdomain protein [Actinotalea fermentans]
MIAEAVVAGAERHAGELLGVGTARWHHSAGVATAAASLSRMFSEEDAELLVAAAWLHDIGYCAELLDTGFHPLDGARHLRALGAPDRLCRLIANHTGAWAEAESRGLAELLTAEFPAEQSPVADALTYADLTTGPAGQPLSAEERIAEILERYEAGHVVHRSIRQVTPELLATVRRVEQTLAPVQPR